LQTVEDTLNANLTEIEKITLDFLVKDKIKKVNWMPKNANLFIVTYYLSKKFYFSVKYINFPENM